MTVRDSVPLLLAAICLIGVNMRVTITGVGPLLEQLSESTGNSLTTLSLLTSVPVLCWGLLSPLAHPLSQRFGMNRVVLWSLVLLCVGTGVRSLPGPEFSLWFGSLLLGVALAVANVLLPAVVKRSFPSRVPLVTGVYTALFSGFGAIASGLVVPISHIPTGGDGTAGWRVALVAVALTLPIAVLLWLLHLRRHGADPGRRPSRRHERGPSVWGDPVAWLVGGYMAVQAVGFYALLTWLPTFVRSLGRSEVEAGIDLMIFQLVGVVASLVAPLSMRGRGERWVPAVLGVLSVIGLVGFLTAPDLLVVWIVASGLAGGGAVACALTLMATRARDHHTASRLSGMAQSVGYVFAAAAPIAVGTLHTATGGWIAPFAFLLVAALAQVVVGVLVGRDRHVFDRLPA